MTRLVWLLLAVAFAAPRPAHALPTLDQIIGNASQLISDQCATVCPVMTVACLDPCLRASTESLVKCLSSCIGLNGLECSSLPAVHDVSVTFKCLPASSNASGLAPYIPVNTSGYCRYLTSQQGLFVPAFLGLALVALFYAWWFVGKPFPGRRLPTPINFLEDQVGVKLIAKLLVTGMCMAQLIAALVFGAGSNSIISATEDGATIFRLIAYLCLVPICFWPTMLGADLMDTRAGALLGLLGSLYWWCDYTMGLVCPRNLFISIRSLAAAYYALFWLEALVLVAIFARALFVLYTSSPAAAPASARFLPFFHPETHTAFLRAHRLDYVRRLLSRRPPQPGGDHIGKQVTKAATPGEHVYAHRPRGLAGKVKARSVEVARGNPSCPSLWAAWKNLAADVAFTLWGASGGPRVRTILSSRMLLTMNICAHSVFGYMISEFANAEGDRHLPIDLGITLGGIADLYTTTTIADGVYPLLLYRSRMVGVAFVSLGLYFLCWHMLRAHTDRRQRLALADYSFLPRDLSGMSTGFAIIYPGCQVAFFYVGAKLLFTVVFSAVFFTGLAIENKEFRSRSWDFFAHKLDYLLPIWLAVFWKLFARFIVNFVFTADRRFAVRFTDPFFHTLEYLSFIVNIVVGFASYVFRILATIAILLIVFVRCDKCAMPRGFEDFDIGYMSYSSALLLEALHLNPVAGAFVDLLRRHRRIAYRFQHGPAAGLPAAKSTATRAGSFAPPVTDAMTERLLASSDHDADDRPVLALGDKSPGGDGDAGPRVISQLARNRWLLAYSLLRNPSLRQMRSHAAAAIPATLHPTARLAADLDASYSSFSVA